VQKLILTISLLTVFTLSVHGQQFEAKYDHIGSVDGLASQICTRLIEDDLGNIWISNYKEINKYNGYDISIFNNRNSKLKDNIIIDLAVDKNGFIWVIQISKQSYEEIGRHIHKTENYIVNIIDPITNEMQSLKEYCGREAKLFKQIECREKKIFLIDSLDNLYSYASSFVDENYKVDYKRHIGIGNQNNVYLYNEKTRIIESRDFDNNLLEEYPLIDSSKYITSVVNREGQIITAIRKSDKTIYIDPISVRKLHEDDIRNEEFLKKIVLDFCYKIKLSKKHINFEVINERLVLPNSFQEIFKRPGIGGKTINDFLVKETGLTYFATNVGVYIYNIKELPFKKFKSNYDTLNTVRGVLMDKDLQLYRYDATEFIESPNNSYSSDFLKSVTEEYIAFYHYRDIKNKKKVWTLPSGRVIDLESKSVEYKKIIPGGFLHQCFRSRQSGKMYLVGDKGLYVGDDNDNNFKVLTSYKEFFNGESVLASYLNEVNGKIWVATDKGIIEYNELENKYYQDTIFKNHIPDKIQYYHQDKIDKNIIWIGTTTGGLKRWNRDTQSVDTYDDSNILSNNNIHFIHEDNKERLWITTNKHLNCLDKKSNKNYVFTEEDGLNNSEFNKYSFYFNDEDNLLYLGGLNGYNYFNPDSLILKSQKSIKLRIISAIKTTNDSKIKNIYQHILSENKIEFLESDMSIDLEFSSNNLYHNQNSSFSYRIPGISKTWRTQKSNHIKLAGLPYGQHNLEVISDINSPSKISEVFNLSLVVMKPFYKKLWFQILSILFALLLLRFLIMQRLKSISDRNLILEKTVKARTIELEKANELKSKLFTILAHDIKGPLSSLKNLSEKTKFLISNNRMNELNEIYDSTSNKIDVLDENMNNILLWALKENELEPNIPVSIKIKSEIDQILLLYEDRLTLKNIDIKNNIRSEDVITLDKSIFQVVLRNTLSNAIKFTFDDGYILIYSEIERGKTDTYNLYIKDKGPGLVPADNPKIKDKKGTGLGLQITEELCNLADIQLVLKNNEQSDGTIACIKIPILN